MIYFEVPGEPKGKGRPRFTGTHTYTPEATVNYENWVKTCFIQQAKQKKLEGAIHAEIICRFEVPKSWNAAKKQSALLGRISPMKKPDIDNIAKIILDSLNGLAYDDDKQVTFLYIYKVYGNEAKTEIYLREEEA